MNIVDVCKLKYPGQIEVGNISFRQPDGEILIDFWNVPNELRPLESELLTYGLQNERQIEINILSLECAAIIQRHIDSIAKSKKYDSGFSCAGYVTSTNIQWVAEAQTFIAWRDAVWEYAYNLLDEALSGIIPIPTVEAVISGIPVIVWPA